MDGISHFEFVLPIAFSFVKALETMTASGTELADFDSYFQENLVQDPLAAISLHGGSDLFPTRTLQFR
jgi:hypothetical protein